jgi:multidrug efflux pump subunit AcrA (membrane-fusion protein)
MNEETKLLTPPPTAPALPAPKKTRVGKISIIVIIIFVVIAIIGIIMRMSSESHLKKKTDIDAIPTVSVIKAAKAAPTENVVLPGTVQAWHEAIVYARTAGYLKSWSADIGAQVKAGDVLAQIDAPDLDAQFHQAQADLETAIANNSLAQITAKRDIALRKTDSISAEQADTAVAQAAADSATVDSEKANLDHLQQEENFKTIIAPFDGTITQRNTDVGSLINGGSSSTTSSSSSSSSTTTTTTNSSTTGQDLFHIADTSKLRIYVEVPESNASAIKPDMMAELHFPQLPQQTLTAKLARTSDALDPTTRTLLIELELDNADSSLLSGGYADVTIKIPTDANTILLPVNALLFRDGMQAAVVTNNHVTLKNITIGRDYGKSVEITDGLSEGDSVVINPPDSLESGQQVRIASPKQTGTNKTDTHKTDPKKP